MKFALLICGDDSEWSYLPADEEQDLMKEIYGWYEKWQPTGKIADGGAELQPQTTARTIRTGADGGAVVTDDQQCVLHGCSPFRGLSPE